MTLPLALVPQSTGVKVQGRFVVPDDMSGQSVPGRRRVS